MRRLTTREQVLLGLVAVGGTGYLWYASQHAVTATTGPFEFASDGRRLADGAPRVPMALLDLVPPPISAAGIGRAIEAAQPQPRAFGARLAR